MDVIGVDSSLHAHFRAIFYAEVMSTVTMMAKKWKAEKNGQMHSDSGARIFGKERKRVLSDNKRTYYM